MCKKVQTNILPLKKINLNGSVRKSGSKLRKNKLARMNYTKGDSLVRYYCSVGHEHVYFMCGPLNSSPLWEKKLGAALHTSQFTKFFFTPFFYCAKQIIYKSPIKSIFFHIYYGSFFILKASTLKAPIILYYELGSSTSAWTNSLFSTFWFLYSP